MIHFVLGGARSGKSNFAEQQALSLAKTQHKQAVYIATATAFDDEMTARINKHQQDRHEKFKLIESPLALSNTLNQTQPANIYLLDCLTLWLNNVIYSKQGTAQNVSKEEIDEHLRQEIDLLVCTLVSQFSSENYHIIIVSNEVGLGVIPMGESTRLFVDYCGWLNQKIASIAQQVTLLTAGIPLTLKSSSYNE